VRTARDGRPAARQVLWTEQALERLQEIEEFIAQDAPERAADFIDRLIQRGESLSDMPAVGRRVPELNSDEIRERLEGNYRIVYRLKEQSIEILTVFEGHQQFPYKEISLTVQDKATV